MEIVQKRILRAPNSTISELYVDGHWRCYILEDADRGLTSDMSLTEIKNLKVWGHTAIPTGRYRVTLRHSPKFRRFLPWLRSVPGYEYVYMHPGNWIKDTDGCTLPGTSYMLQNGEYTVRSSVKAFTPLLKEIIDNLDRKQSVWYQIINAYETT